MVAKQGQASPPHQRAACGILLENQSYFGGCGECQHRRCGERGARPKAQAGREEKRFFGFAKNSLFFDAVSGPVTSDHCRNYGGGFETARPAKGMGAWWLEANTPPSEGGVSPL